MGLFVTFVSRLMSSIRYGVFARLSSQVSRPKRISELLVRVGFDHGTLASPTGSVN
jgi:hypothetical protein